jgi:hypothetical protein
MFPPSPGKESLPSGLLSHFERRKDLVYYDWEITQFKLEQWRKVRNLLPLFPAHDLPAAPKTDSPAALLITDDAGSRLALEETWLGALAPLLGESVTELRQVSSGEFTFERKSACGFTGLELIYVAHWLTEPGTRPAGQYAGTGLSDR